MTNLEQLGLTNVTEEEILNGEKLPVFGYNLNTFEYTDSKVLTKENDYKNGAWVIPYGYTSQMLLLPQDSWTRIWLKEYKVWSYQQKTLTAEEALQNARKKKIEELNINASIAYTQGFWSKANGSNMLYDSTRDDQSVIQLAGAIATRGDEVFNEQFPNGYPIRARKEYRGTEKEILHLTAPQMIVLGSDWVNYYKEVKGQVWAIQQVINTAPNVDSLDGVDLHIKTWIDEYQQKDTNTLSNTPTQYNN